MHGSTRQLSIDRRRIKACESQLNILTRQCKPMQGIAARGHTFPLWIWQGASRKRQGYERGNSRHGARKKTGHHWNGHVPAPKVRYESDALLWVRFIAPERLYCLFATASPDQSKCTQGTCNPHAPMRRLRDAQEVSKYLFT